MNRRKLKQSKFNSNIDQNSLLNLNIIIETTRAELYIAKCKHWYCFFD